LNLKNFLQNQIDKGNTNWESRSALIRAANEQVNGHTNRIVKEFEQKFRFGSAIEQKNKEIKKYFNKQPKNSLISVVGTVKTINLGLPEDNQISETIIYNRLDDPKFNENNLKGQPLNNQVSKTAPYDVKITKNLKDQLKQIRKPGIYLYLEITQRGGSTLRLKTNEYYGNLDRSFPPNEDSLKLIKKLINERRKSKNS
tara:strand:- start:204 stop:800 length:597 start_codon:yes stop_codon:yes gene_type:complete